MTRSRAPLTAVLDAGSWGTTDDRLEQCLREGFDEVPDLARGGVR
jgi:hypothetical protein